MLFRHLIPIQEVDSMNVSYEAASQFLKIMFFGLFILYSSDLPKSFWVPGSFGNFPPFKIFHYWPPKIIQYHLVQNFQNHFHGALRTPSKSFRITLRFWGSCNDSATMNHNRKSDIMWSPLPAHDWESNSIQKSFHKVGVTKNIHRQSSCSAEKRALVHIYFVSWLLCCFCPTCCVSNTCRSRNPLTQRRQVSAWRLETTQFIKSTRNDVAQHTPVYSYWGHILLLRRIQSSLKTILGCKPSGNSLTWTATFGHILLGAATGDPLGLRHPPTNIEETQQLNRSVSWFISDPLIESPMRRYPKKRK